MGLDLQSARRERGGGSLRGEVARRKPCWHKQRRRKERASKKKPSTEKEGDKRASAIFATIPGEKIQTPVTRGKKTVCVLAEGKNVLPVVAKTGKNSPGKGELTGRTSTTRKGGGACCQKRCASSQKGNRGSLGEKMKDVIRKASHGGGRGR